MREVGPAEVTRRVYVTMADSPRRHGQGRGSDCTGAAYIWRLRAWMDFTYALVSGYIPLFCTEYRPW